MKAANLPFDVGHVMIGPLDFLFGTIENDESPKTKPQKVKPKPANTSNLDLDPDAWPKFEKLVKSAAKMGHKPHATEKPPRKT